MSDGLFMRDEYYQSRLYQKVRNCLHDALKCGLERDEYRMVVALMGMIYETKSQFEEARRTSAWGGHHDF